MDPIASPAGSDPLDPKFSSPASGVPPRRADRPGGGAFATLPGLLIAGGLAVLAVQLATAGWMQANGIGPLTVAMLLGMLVGNTVFGGRVEQASNPGLNLAKRRLLRLGIILYGLRLTFQDIGHVGMAGVVIDAVVLCTTFAFACVVGIRFLGIDRETAMLIGVGHSVCGATAVMAAEPVVRGSTAQVSVAIATVAFFGTLATVVYPALYHLNLTHHWVEMAQRTYGIYVGSTVHEVAQVVAAGRAIGDEAADAAVIAKMVRVMMLAPFLIGLSAYLARESTKSAVPTTPGEGHTTTYSAGFNVPGVQRKIMVPWFAVIFVLVVALNSVVSFPMRALVMVANFDNALLATAMVAIGLSTRVSAIRAAGLKPLLLAGLLFAWLIAGGWLINAAIHAVLG